MWNYFNYKRRGISHERDNTECQDSVLICENDFCIVSALADGLGSLKHSKIASDIATQATCDFFLSKGSQQPQLLSEDEINAFRYNFITHITSQVKEKASELCLDASLMDCTLVFVCISKTDNQAIIGRIGDSAVCLINESNSIVLNDSTDSANGTSAILDKNSYEYLNVSTYKIDSEGILGFILTSDGLDNEIYSKGSYHVNQAAEDYFNAALKADPETFIKNKIDHLTSLPGDPFDDDISLAIISRATKPIKFECDPLWLCTCGHRNKLQNTYCVNCHQDFSELYQNVSFRDYGGKTSFFIYINKHPEKEKEILGLSNGIVTTGNKVASLATNTISKPNTSNNTSHTPTNSGASNRTTFKNSRCLLLIICFSCIVVGIIIGILISNLRPPETIESSTTATTETDFYSTSVSTESSEEPSASTTSPEETTEEPSASTTSPEETTEEPSASTTSPEETTEEPSASTTSPEETTEEPSTSTTSPEETTEESSASTTSPEETTEEPSASTTSPEETTEAYETSL